MNPNHRSALLRMNDCAQESAVYVRQFKRRLANAFGTSQFDPSAAITAADKCAHALNALHEVTLEALEKNDSDNAIDA
jgi:hypothetical protein